MMAEQIFKVGDKVRVISRSESVPYGTILTVAKGPIGFEEGGNYEFYENKKIVLGVNLKLVGKLTKKQRIEVLETQVSDLTQTVEKQAEQIAELQSITGKLREALA